MYCVKCGKSVTDDQKFCIYCGNKIDEINCNNKAKKLHKKNHRKNSIFIISVSALIIILLLVILDCLGKEGIGYSFEERIEMFNYVSQGKKMQKIILRKNMVLMLI